MTKEGRTRRIIDTEEAGFTDYCYHTFDTLWDGLRARGYQNDFTFAEMFRSVLRGAFRCSVCNIIAMAQYGSEKVEGCTTKADFLKMAAEEWDTCMEEMKRFQATVEGKAVAAELGEKNLKKNLN